MYGQKRIALALAAFLLGGACSAAAAEGLLPFEERTLVISEVCAAHPPKSDEADWVELFNPGTEPVDLSGWQISDREDREGLALTGMVEAESYAVVSLAKADFGISTKGETVFLRDASGELKDSFQLGATTAGVTAGREAGEEACAYYTEATPGAENAKPLTERLPAPEANETALYRTEPFELVLSCEAAGAEIRYTLDGSAPKPDSALYTGPVRIEKSVTVRAVAVGEGALNSFETTLNFLFTEPHTVPVICFSGEAEELNAVFKKSRGHTRPEFRVRVSFYEPNGSFGTGFPADLRIKGNASTGSAYPQKSLAVHLRKAYGQGKAVYPFFGGDASETLSGFTLRSGGQDSNRTHLKDAFASRIAQATNTLAAKTRAVVVYRNARYAGVYWLTETINEEWLAREYGLDEEDIEIVDRVHGVQAGSGERYRTALDFAKKSTLAGAENYARMEELLDIDAQTDTLILKMFLTDVDMYNQRWWSGPDGKLRSVFFDNDLIFMQGDENKVTVSRQFRLGSSKFAGNVFNAALRKNAGWRERFIDRYAELTQTVLSRENLLNVFEATVAELAPEMERHIRLYGKPDSIAAWNRYVDIVRSEIGRKETAVTQQLCREFGLSESEMAERMARYAPKD